MGAPLIFIAALVLLAGPILAILALVSVRRLESDQGNSRLRELTSRIFALEQQVQRLKDTLTAHATAPQAAPAHTEPKIRIEVPTAGEATTPSSGTLPPPAPHAQPGLHGPHAETAQTSSAAARPNVSPGALRPIPVAQKASQPADLESMIGGRWFNRIGIVALLIAVSYFLKLAFDNNWIGPSGRVAIGVLLGALMLPWSQWLLGRGYTYFSEGITALGEATLFVSVWAGCQFYTLYSKDVGFAGMIAITAVMAAVAIGRDSQRIAVLSLLGGLLAPVLASSGKDAQVVLFTYLLLLGSGAAVIAAKKEWGSLAPIGFVGTQIYFWGWYSEFYHGKGPLERTIVFASLFFFLYSALPIWKAARGRFREAEIVLVLASEFAYSGALFVLLWPDDKWPLTLLAIALAAAHVGAARLLPAPRAGEPAIARLLYAGLALTYLTLAIPVRLEGKWITLSFAAEGAILVWSGFRAASSFLRQAGYLLLSVSALRLLFLPPAGGAFFANERFAAYLVMIACFGAALWAANSHQEDIDGQELTEVGIFAVAINMFALIALSIEFWDHFGKSSSGMDAALAQHLALSILWTAYATALLILGVQMQSALLRWQGLVLLGLVVVKVFVYDLSFLDRAYRIFSFFVLGAVLLGVSFLYQRKVARERGSG